MTANHSQKPGLGLVIRNCLFVGLVLPLGIMATIVAAVVLSAPFALTVHYFHNRQFV